MKHRARGIDERTTQTLDNDDRPERGVPARQIRNRDDCGSNAEMPSDVGERRRAQVRGRDDGRAEGHDARPGRGTMTATTTGAVAGGTAAAATGVSLPDGVLMVAGGIVVVAALVLIALIVWLRR